MNAAQHYRAVAVGRRSKEAGAYFEKIIDAACNHYHLMGQAEIAKTPEPMRPIKYIGQGRFIAYFEKMAQPDYKGTLANGRAVVFEAKHTDGKTISQNVVSSEQRSQLESHQRLGAECFVLVSFRFEKFYKIPWQEWQCMKERRGRKYMTEEDAKKYEVPYINGMLCFLDKEGERIGQK